MGRPRVPGGRNGGQTSPSDSRTQAVWPHLSSVKNPQKHWEERAGGWAPGVAVVLSGAAVQRQAERARAATNPLPSVSSVCALPRACLPGTRRRPEEEPMEEEPPL